MVGMYFSKKIFRNAVIRQNGHAILLAPSGEFGDRMANIKRGQTVDPRQLKCAQNHGFFVRERTSESLKFGLLEEWLRADQPDLELVRRGTGTKSAGTGNK